MYSTNHHGHSEAQRSCCLEQSSILHPLLDVIVRNEESAATKSRMSPSPVAQNVVNLTTPCNINWQGREAVLGAAPPRPSTGGWFFPPFCGGKPDGGRAAAPG